MPGYYHDFLTFGNRENSRPFLAPEIFFFHTVYYSFMMGLGDIIFFHIFIRL